MSSIFRVRARCWEGDRSRLAPSRPASNMPGRFSRDVASRAHFAREEVARLAERQRSRLYCVTGEGTMISKRNSKPGNSSTLWAARLCVVALISAGIGSSMAWAQFANDFTPRVQPQAQAPQAPQKKRLPAAHAATVPPAPKLNPVTLSEADVVAAGALTAALSACDKASESADVIALPGARGEVKLDHCYRGRDHLVCSLGALLREGKALFEDYGKIVDANYPNVTDVNGVCGIKPDNLATDFKDAAAFESRFRVLKAEYGARTSCAAKVEQSLRDVSLPDMVRAPDILKSMIDSIEGDLKEVVNIQQQVLALGEKIDSSQKAMVPIRKVHRTMCMRQADSTQRSSDAQR